MEICCCGSSGCNKPPPVDSTEPMGTLAPDTDKSHKNVMYIGKWMKNFGLSLLPCMLDPCHVPEMGYRYSDASSVHRLWRSDDWEKGIFIVLRPRRERRPYLFLDPRRGLDWKFQIQPNSGGGVLNSQSFFCWKMHCVVDGGPACPVKNRTHTHTRAREHHQLFAVTEIPKFFTHLL